jgi:prephenate dehydrogenase
VRIAILGLGLIGGSLARALRAHEGALESLPALARDATAEPGLERDRIEIAAWSPSGDGPRRALDAGVVDLAAGDPVEAVAGAALVVLAGPVHAVIAAIDALAGTDTLDPETTVTDVASTKRAVVAAADAAGLRFVGGHPLAGRETSGFDASDASLFHDRPWVVVSGRRARPVDVGRVEWLARAAGATPIRTTAGEHDAAVAQISQLPLVVAAALAEAVARTDDWPSSLARQLAATGWTSATRLARGEPTMGASMLTTNARETAAAIAGLQAVLDEWREVLGAESRRGIHRDDLEAVRDRLARARAALERPAEPS